jgi:hypothetical protein
MKHNHSKSYLSCVTKFTARNATILIFTTRGHSVPLHLSTAFALRKLINVVFASNQFYSVVYHKSAIFQWSTLTTVPTCVFNNTVISDYYFRSPIRTLMYVRKSKGHMLSHRHMPCGYTICKRKITCLDPLVRAITIHQRLLTFLCDGPL